MGLPALIHYPGWDEETKTQLFPFRTMAMLMSLITLVGVSWGTKHVFETGKLAPGYDWFRCVVNIPDDVERVDDPSEAGEQMSVMAAGPMGKLYGAATMVGKDEMNGRINPALEPDDDMDPNEIARLEKLGQVTKSQKSQQDPFVAGSYQYGAGGGPSSRGSIPSSGRGGPQSQTAL